MLLLLLPLLAQTPEPPAEPPADPVVERRRAQVEVRAAARELQRARDSAQRVLMAVFQEDRLTDLGREECLNRMVAFDRDEDARVSFEEFERLVKWSPFRSPRGNDTAMKAEDAWTVLLRFADADADGVLAHEEALAYFDERDLDHNGLLTRNERADGPRVGEKAPDFALAPPGEGELQSLSALIKQGKPVALLFGAYS